jgi:hypothetical protein
LPSLTFYTYVLIYDAGWAAEWHTHWIVVDVGIFGIAAGMIFVFSPITVYVVDTYKTHSASALTAVTFLRSCCAFGLPLLAPAMYEALGYGKGDSILAASSVILGMPSLWFLIYYGEKIRERSRYATA